MDYYSSGNGMAHADASFASAQAAYDAAEPPEPEFQGEVRVLRAVVYLTYDDTTVTDEDDVIENCQPPYDAEKDIKAVLTASTYGRKGPLKYHPDKVEVVDAEYMSQEESEG